MTEKFTALIPGFSYNCFVVSKYTLASIYPIGDLPIDVVRFLASRIDGIDDVERCFASNRYSISVTIRENFRNPLAQLAEALRELFDPIIAAAPHSFTEYSQDAVPGFQVRRRGKSNENYTITCPLYYNYLGIEKLRLIAKTVQGVGYLFGGDYSNPDQISVTIAQHYQNQADRVIMAFVRALSRSFPVLGNIGTHSALHHNALVLSDIEPGMKVTRFLRGNSQGLETVTVSEILEDENNGRAVLHLSDERLVYADDFGLTPYKQDTPSAHWSLEYYTLATTTIPDED